MAGLVNSPRAETVWLAPAKLNLFLHVTGRRADGYHELQTAFQFLDYGDELWFDVSSSGAIELQTALPGVPAEHNLVLRAARSLARHAGCKRGVRIGMHKRLPLGGGVGGGSSDAATTLVALNSLWGLGLGVNELARLGLELGADVPVFVYGQAAWAEGVGEQLTPLMELDEPWYLVISPEVSVSTAEIFSAPELTRNAPRLKIRDFLSGVGNNQLQDVVVQRYPEVGRVLDWLSRHRPARMTGSGGCVFAPFPVRQEAESLLRQVPPPWTGFVARGCNRSPLLKKLEQLHA
jgi:4-diphosphocytidyl-2-C-methyl-D-erythritol kinase